MSVHRQYPQLWLTAHVPAIWRCPGHVQLWKPQGKHRTYWRDYLSHMAWEHFRIHQQELDIAREKGISGYLVWPAAIVIWTQRSGGEWRDGWMEAEHCVRIVKSHFKVLGILVLCFEVWSNLPWLYFILSPALVAKRKQTNTCVVLTEPVPRLHTDADTPVPMLSLRVPCSRALQHA